MHIIHQQEKTKKYFHNYEENINEYNLDRWRNRITNNYVSFNVKKYKLYVKMSEENQIFHSYHYI